MALNNQAGGAERRTAPRISVSLPVLINASGSQHAAQLRNISNGGALLEGRTIPERGTRIILSCGTIEADATVVWNGVSAFGLRFTTAVTDTVVDQQVARSEAMASRRMGLW
jgi:PilZ domain